MKLLVIKCPECNAKVEVSPEAQQIACEYCGTKAQVQRRAGLLQRPVPLAPRSPQQAQLPIAIQQGKSYWWAWILLALIPLGIAAPCVGSAIVCSMEKGEEAARKAKFTAPQWGGSGVLTRDLNGDGVWDIVGYMYRNREKSGSQSLLVALDGTSGKALWPAVDLGERGSQTRNPQGVVGDLLVLSDGGSKLMAVALKEGRVAWRGQLPEKIKRVCAGDGGATVNVFTADKKMHLLTLADGKVKGAKQATESACKPVVSLDPTKDRPGRQICHWHSGCGAMVLRDKVAGISSMLSLYRPSKKLAIALARKKPGTSVPMLAAYRWPAEVRPGDAAFKVLWKAALPPDNPLEVETRDLEPAHVGLDDEVVAAAYKRTGKSNTVHLTAFSVVDGKRLWDVDLGRKDSAEGVVVTPTHIVASLWHSLFVVDRKTGAIAHSIVFSR